MIQRSLDGRMAMAESPRGRFVWYEMLTVDKGPTIDFYEEPCRNT